MHPVLGLVGAAIVACSAVYYAVDVLRGNTRPQRTSWGVWALVGVLGFGSADAGGAGPGAYAAGVDAIACIATFALSMHPRLGKPGGRRTDLLLAAVAVVGVVLWRWGPLGDTGAAVLAVSCESVALWPTLRDGWRNPQLESLASWAADIVGNTLCISAVATVSVASLAFPVYVLGAAVAMTVLLTARRAASRLRGMPARFPSAAPSVASPLPG
jgi:hypothetical protein